MISRTVLGTAGILVVSTCCFSEIPSFEAASIKPSSLDRDDSGVVSSKGRLSMKNVTLKRCVRGAYNIPDILIAAGPSGPKWLDEDRFNIEARAAGPVADSKLMVMLGML